jgi:EmrB/QacA subfamily drug resistance transporter
MSAVLREPPMPNLRGGRRDLVLAAVCTLLFLTFLDNTIVSVALGDIQRETHAGVQSLQWIVNAYALVFASMMLAAGALGDRIGHRKVMLAGASVFAAGSVICALADTSGVLIGGRAVMGLGAAASEPATLAMLRHLYPGRRERARATGVWAGVSGLALALGPVIGGVIVGVANWHWIFWFNLAFGLAALVIGARLLPEAITESARRVDVLGAGLGAAALSMLVFGVIEGESAGFTSERVLALFVGAAVAGVAFVWWQRRAAEPLLDPAYVRTPAFAASNFVAFAAYFGTFAVFFFCALYLNVVVGDSGLRVAAEFVPMMVAMILGSVVTGRWMSRTGRVSTRGPIVAGCLLFAAGLTLIDRVLRPDQPFASLAGALTVAGIGIGIAVVPTTFAAVNAVPLDRAGMASSAVNTSREVGAVAGTAVLGAIVNASLISHLNSQLDKLGLSTLKQVIIPQVLHGGAALTGSGGGSVASHATTPLARKLLDSVYSAFYSGLHVCLLVSAIIVGVAGVVAAVALRREGALQPVGEADRADAESAAESATT